MHGVHAFDRILVIGGDEEARTVLSTELRDAGFQVDSVDALGSEKHDCRLIVSLCATQPRDEIKCIEEIAAIRRGIPDSIVVACVSRARLEMVETVLEAGVDEIVLFPPIRSALVARIRAGLTRLKERSAESELDRLEKARALESELRTTKDFLERLIDSTVDGIIATDMNGRVLIFNQGAARLYGYRPEEVIGQMHASKLCQRGTAQLILEQLRSEDFGGKGRLEPSRKEIVTRDGELVPVILTASIIYKEGCEVASVGVMRDLRERLRIEERLHEAQERLVATEKQAIVAELAGAAAHELNQPLTSVMGYSELLKRKLGPENPHCRTVDVILREAERMAEIVRKIGRITRYETKAYVGSATILDLDKSCKDG
jgi:PAS domain S-box-containing protein